jgi:hypothetical protein
MTEPKTYPTKVKHVLAMRWDGTKESTEALTAWVAEHNLIARVHYHLPTEGRQGYLLLRQPATPHAVNSWYHAYVMPTMWLTLSTRGTHPWFKAMTDRVFRSHHEVEDELS